MSELLRGYAVTTLCGWSVFPLLHRLLPRLPDRGYSLCRCFGVLMASWIAWVLGGAARRPPSMGIAVLAILLTLSTSVVAAVALRPGSRGGTLAEGERLRSFLARGRPWILRVELLFLGGLLLFAWLEGHNPAVDPDSERFMDYALLRACLRSPGLPVPDPWFAGRDLSYYHFGYAMVAFLVRAAGSEPARFFITAVSLQHALLWSAAFGAGLALTGRPLGGGIAAFFVLGAGNGEWLRQWTRLAGTTPFDWFASSRAIDGAITEFPWFSMLWGDLHPYVMALPIAACALTFVMAEGLPSAIIDGASRGDFETVSLRLARAGCFALMTGALLATHPWDVPVVACAAVLLTLASPGPGRTARLLSIVLAATVSGLLYVPFLRGLVRASPGIGAVAARTRPGEWIMAYLPFVLLAMVSAIWMARPALRRWSEGSSLPARDRLAASLVASGLVTALACELVYVRDLFESTSLYRMNTVFKFYRLSWLFFGLASAAILVRLTGRWAGGRRRAPRLAALFSCAAVLISALVYPVWGTIAWVRARSVEAARSGSLSAAAAQSPGADAEGLFRALDPGDAEAAGFVAGAASPGESLLEETGEPYTWSARLSTFSGVPTVLGWGNHEAVWRHDWREVLERTADVQTMYQQNGTARACDLVRKYGVRWIVIGERERRRYGPAAVAPAAGRKVFDSHGTEVYDVAGVCGPPAPTGRLVP